MRFSRGFSCVFWFAKCTFNQSINQSSRQWFHQMILFHFKVELIQNPLVLLTRNYEIASIFFWINLDCTHIELKFKFRRDAAVVRIFKFRYQSSTASYMFNYMLHDRLISYGSGASFTGVATRALFRRALTRHRSHVPYIMNWFIKI